MSAFLAMCHIDGVFTLTVYFVKKYLRPYMSAARVLELCSLGRGATTGGEGPYYAVGSFGHLGVSE